MKILCIIPARGGSKGVPRKNIKLLGGKPLIQYTIESAQKSRNLNKIMVSTNDEEIAAISEKLGMNVPELRPNRLASDTSPTIDTVLYTLQYYERNGELFDAVCLLQPTSPFRDEGSIDTAIEIFKNTDADSLVSVSKVPHEYNPHWVFEPDPEGKFLQIATGEAEIITRRQALPNAYYRNGSIYLVKTSVVLEQHSLYGKNISFIEMDARYLVNIDTMEDWGRAEHLAATIFPR